MAVGAVLEVQTERVYAPVRTSVNSTPTQLVQLSKERTRTSQVPVSLIAALVMRFVVLQVGLEPAVVPDGRIRSRREITSGRPATTGETKSTVTVDPATPWKLYRSTSAMTSKDPFVGVFSAIGVAVAAD